MDKGIEQHFRKEEQPFLDAAAGWAAEVEDRYAPKLTGFLDPRQRFIVRAVTGGRDLVIAESGGLPDAERRRLLIAPPYLDAADEDFEITVMEVRYPVKFADIGHRDVLGSITGLGIDRSRFGDIRTGDGTIQFAADTALRDYMAANLTSIGKTKVRVSALNDDSSLLAATEEWEEMTVTVASLRLDAVLASVLNVSRQKSASLVSSGRVKVNHAVRESPSFELSDSDLLSVRGHGRIRIGDIGGQTRKGRVRLEIGRLA
ncbi:YlmH family RNA-binding protein [Edaphobacillus lindanitolerans]|uniref:RNA-binding protein YlmH, contains S4-like domain n=1 Tax=Edaphobacillus lindanitolerans TaxID=550447 RepID=A0A1U7PL53_9BACI|nr:RNA-binding protein [Edaphobacillus lindanitolerans]SIT67756.1 RNA-binding protein YlmH, contains S4-like domain [Edaphobacillus lindanitolerans]